MAIGLTGARGVLGRRLVDAFARHGATVIPFAGDVREEEALTAWAKGCTQIVHAAAVVPTVQVKNAPGTAITVNVAGTANVATACAEAGIRLTYISTSHVYASSNAALTVGAAVDPISLYGLTKWQGEQWVARLCTDPLVVRLFSYFDSRQAASFLVPALLRRIREAPKGATLSLFGYRSVRDIADAHWLADRLVAMVLADRTGTHNLGTGIGTGIVEIAARLSSAAGRDDLSWEPADDQPGDTLTAGLVRDEDHPVFDLDDALQTFVHEMGA